MKPERHDPCCKNQRSKSRGQIVISENPEIDYGPGKHSVVTVGDGTCERDTVIHGLFWTEENAELFASALKAKKGTMPDDEWLTKVSDEAAERIVAHSQRQRSTEATRR